MSSFLRNPEIKRAIMKLLIFQIIFSVLLFLFIRQETLVLHKTIINQNQALIGNILYNHPELEKDIIKLATKKATKEAIEKGKTILSQYGYEEGIAVSSEPILSKFYSKFQVNALIFAMLYFIPLLLFLLNEYRGVFSKVRKISIAAEKVVEGDYCIVLPDDREGEFGILGHNFNIMAVRLKESIGKLKEEKVFLKNIISDISHQMKTPLSSLIMFNELMLENKDMKDEQRKDFLIKIKSQLNRMEWLILNLLKMARLEAGAIDFKKERISIIKPVSKAINILKYKAEEKGLRLILKSDDEHIYFYGDEEWTAEAMINIIKNCIEHTKENEDITIEVGETPLFSRIIIKDRGEGIDSKDLPHIFERFYKGNNSVKVESVGIGLALTKLIIEEQGGTISVYSERGKGTKFEITFLKGII